MKSRTCETCCHFDGALCMRKVKREGAVVIGAQKPKVARAHSILIRPDKCGKFGQFWKQRK